MLAQVNGSFVLDEVEGQLIPSNYARNQITSIYDTDICYVAVFRGLRCLHFTHNKLFP